VIDERDEHDDHPRQGGEISVNSEVELRQHYQIDKEQNIRDSEAEECHRTMGEQWRRGPAVLEREHQTAEQTGHRAERVNEKSHIKDCV
jgi:hypothetical protein